MQLKRKLAHVATQVFHADLMKRTFTCCSEGPMLELPSFIVIPAMRRGARVAESACLESTCAGNGTVGSNPTLSAMTSR